MNAFSLQRTGLLLKKQWVENLRYYLMSILALAGLLAIAFSLWLIAGRSYDEKMIYALGFIGLFFSGAIFASTSYHMLSAKDTGIYWISFPASHLEKLLVTLFYNVVVFTVVYLLIFFTLKWVSDSIIDYLIANAGRLYSYHRLDKVNDAPFVDAIPILWSAFFAIQAAYMLGSVYFSKLSFIITTVVLVVLFFLFLIFSLKLFDAVFPADSSLEFFSLNVYEGDKVKEYQIPQSLRVVIDIFRIYLLAPILWLITWFRLKEKQI